MINEKMLTLTKRLGAVIILIVVLILGIGLGGIGKVKKSEVAKVVKTANQTQSSSSQASQKEEEKQLQPEEVEKFLIAYYTKKDLEENRSRYKPYMTDSMYQAEIQREEKPVNQAYKGFVIDQVFEKANIYLDTANNVALVEVSYTNTVLQDLEDRDTALTNQPNQATLRLTYDQVQGKFLVNNMENILLDDNLAAIQTDYIDFRPSSSSSSSSEDKSSSSNEEKTEANKTQPKTEAEETEENKEEK